MLSIKNHIKQKNLHFLSNFALIYGVGHLRLNNITKNLGINFRFSNLQTKKKVNTKIENFFRRFRYTIHLRNQKKKILSFYGLFVVIGVFVINSACLLVDNGLRQTHEQKKISSFFRYIYDSKQVFIRTKKKKAYH